MDIIKTLIHKENISVDYNFINNNNFIDDNFLDIYKKKLIICKIKNTKNQSGGFVNNNSHTIDDFYQMIKSFDAERKLLLEKYFEKNEKYSLQINPKKIIDYVINKYNFTKSTIFYIGDLFVDLDIDVDYYNKLPKNNKKFTNILLIIRFSYAYFIKHIDSIEQYINHIISNYLQLKGKIIIRCHIDANNSKYVDFLKRISKQFKYLRICYAKNFFNINSIGFIILKNKQKNQMILDIDFDKKISKYLSSYNPYIKNSMSLTNQLLKLKLTDENQYILLCNKIKYVLSY
jgi:hypothetical protein